MTNNLGVSELEFNIPFQHKHGYIRDENNLGYILSATNIIIIMIMYHSYLALDTVDST